MSQPESVSHPDEVTILPGNSCTRGPAAPELWSGASPGAPTEQGGSRPGWTTKEMAAELSEEGPAARSVRATRTRTKALSHCGATVGLEPGLTTLRARKTHGPSPGSAWQRGRLVGPGGTGPGVHRHWTAGAGSGSYSESTARTPGRKGVPIRTDVGERGTRKTLKTKPKCPIHARCHLLSPGAVPRRARQRGG